MKLIIQIPCYNEEKCLPIALNELPRKIEGIDEIEWLIINDGSTDNTVQIAKKCGVDHVVNFNTNRGLAKVFMAGIEECIKLGADIIVNTDADNQYNAHDIDKLIKPILDNQADMVIGTRPISNISHFSAIKKFLSIFGSQVMKHISKTDIEDAPSGFRAISREAALSLNVFSNYTYTMETIILAGFKKIKIKSVPIQVNEKLRESKLMNSIRAYIKKSIFTMFRTVLIYNPSKIAVTIGTLLVAIGIILSAVAIYDNSIYTNALQMLAIISLLLGGQMFIAALITHVLSAQRLLLENIQFKIRTIESNIENSNFKSRSTNNYIK